MSRTAPTPTGAVTSAFGPDDKAHAATSPNPLAYSQDSFPPACPQTFGFR